MALSPEDIEAAKRAVMTPEDRAPLDPFPEDPYRDAPAPAPGPGFMRPENTDEWQDPWRNESRSEMAKVRKDERGIIEDEADLQRKAIDMQEQIRLQTSAPSPLSRDTVDRAKRAVTPAQERDLIDVARAMRGNIEAQTGAPSPLQMPQERRLDTLDRLGNFSTQSAPGPRSPILGQAIDAPPDASPPPPATIGSRLDAAAARAKEAIGGPLLAGRRPIGEALRPTPQNLARPFVNLGKGAMAGMKMALPQPLPQGQTPGQAFDQSIDRTMAPAQFVADATAGAPEPAGPPAPPPAEQPGAGMPIGGGASDAGMFAPPTGSPARTIQGWDMSRVPIDAEHRQGLLGAMDTLKEDKMDQGVLAGGSASNRSELYREMQGIQAVRSAQRENEGLRQRAEIDKLNQQRASYLADTKARPMAPFKQAGADAGDVAAGIAMTLLFGASGLQMFMNQINKNLDRQRDDYDRAVNMEGSRQKAAMAHLDAQDNHFARTREAFKDLNLQSNIAESADLEAMKLRLLREAEVNGSSMARANAKEAADTITMRQKELEAQWNQQAYYRAVVGGGSAASQAQHTVTLPSGKTYAFQTEDDRKKVQERLEAAGKLGGVLQKVTQLRSQLTPGYAMQNPKKANDIVRQLESLEEDALPAWSTANGQGQVKEGERKSYIKNLFPFSRVLDPAADAVIQQQIDQNQGAVQTIVAAHGGELANRGYTMDAAGGIKPAASFAGQQATPKPIGMPPGAIRR